MFFQWLKRYMPRSLYARAALILILPVVTLQLVVSVVFINRHFEGVTEQMTHIAALEMRLILGDINTAATKESALAKVKYLAEGLEIELQFRNTPPTSVADYRRSLDLTGPFVIKMLRVELPELQQISLPDSRYAHLLVDTDFGLLGITFPRHRLSASNAHQLLVNMVFFGILMTVIAIIYMRNQLRPITQLARAAEAFGRGHHVSYTPRGAVEVRAAGNAFLDMRARIERHIEQRTMMLSNVSHDLRTPLTRLKLGLSLLSKADREPLERDVEDMRRLLEEFLNFARGAAEGDAETTDPRALCALIVRDANRTENVVSFATSTGEGTLMMRHLAIRRGVDNLISNAVRYGKDPELSFSLTEKSLCISVEDAGPGIPPEQREEALKPFSRLDPARNQDFGSGVGLGLAITADIARAHGGVLRLGSSDRLGGLKADIVIAR
jgi:two-component system osmolarity sensor histidine kinase EnvZ